MSFRRLRGQENAIRRLQSLLAGSRLPSALLFHGPDGVGKTEAAVEFAKALNCKSQTGNGPCDACESCRAADRGFDADLKRLNAQTQALLLEEDPGKQQHVKIEAVRHLIKDLEMRSLMGRWKVAIIEDAHTMQPAAASALLKSLEEPPPRTLWILVSSRKDQMLPTILSRCHAVAFRSLPTALVTSILESCGVTAEEASRLARMADGSPGMALRIRDAALPTPGSWISDPLAPFSLAEGLPKELHLARPLAQRHLALMVWHLKLGSGPASFGEPRVRRAYFDLTQLGLALNANADPRLIVQIGALTLQEAVR